MNNIIWPQITYIAFLAMSFTISLVNHGKSKGYFSVWITAVAIALDVWIVNAGGFFNVLK